MKKLIQQLFLEKETVFGQGKSSKSFRIFTCEVFLLLTFYFLLFTSYFLLLIFLLCFLISGCLFEEVGEGV